MGSAGLRCGRADESSSARQPVNRPSWSPRGPAVGRLPAAEEGVARQPRASASWSVGREGREGQPDLLGPGPEGGCECEARLTQESARQMGEAVRG